MEKCEYLPECKVHDKSLEEESREKMGFWYITMKFFDFYTMGKEDHRKEFRWMRLLSPLLGSCDKTAFPSVV